jgi:hypothetical protein
MKNRPTLAALLLIIGVTAFGNLALVEGIEFQKRDPTTIIRPRGNSYMPEAVRVFIGLAMISAGLIAHWTAIIRPSKPMVESIAMGHFIYGMFLLISSLLILIAYVLKLPANPWHLLWMTLTVQVAGALLFTRWLGYHMRGLEQAVGANGEPAAASGRLPEDHPSRRSPQ